MAEERSGAPVIRRPAKEARSDREMSRRH